MIALVTFAVSKDQKPDISIRPSIHLSGLKFWILGDGGLDRKYNPLKSAFHHLDGKHKLKHKPFVAKPLMVRFQ